jgi:hypothetical protein
MPMDLLTAKVPDSEILRRDWKLTTVTPSQIANISLIVEKYRRKLWLAVGVVNTPASLVIQGFVRFMLKTEEIVRFPYNVNAFTAGQANNVFIGNNSSFGTASTFNLFDEAIFADLSGKQIGVTPWRLVIEADLCEFVIERFSMAGGDTFFGFLVVQQEYPY